MSGETLLPKIVAPEVDMDVLDVEKRYGSTHAVRGVTLQVRQGEILGLVGENGSGKSTLLRLMGGIEPPDAGQISFRGQDVHGQGMRRELEAGIAIVFQELALLPNLRVFENLFLPAIRFSYRFGVMRKGALRRMCRNILRQYGLSCRPDDYVGDLRFGERQLLEIVRALELPRVFGVEKALILLDEPTAALTQEEVDRLMTFMRDARERASFVFVSHRLSEALSITDRIVLLRDGMLVAERTSTETSEAELHGLMVGRERLVDYFHDAERGEVRKESALEVSHAAGHGFHDVSLHVRPGEIVGLAGLEGSGRSELCEAIYGLRRLREGTVHLAGIDLSHAPPHRKAANRMAYLPKERLAGGVIEGFTIARNVGLHLLGSDILAAPRRERKVTETLIERFRVKAPGPHVEVGKLSGGNQQKIALGKWLIGDPKVLILDNPTRGVDVGARTEIYSAIRKAAARGAGVLMACDDLNELLGLCDRVYVMKDGMVTEMMETYSPEYGHTSVTERDLVSHMA